MSNFHEPRTRDVPVDPDSLLARSIERHCHLYADVSMCIGVLLLTVCIVVAAHVLADCLRLHV
jgi:hypothetical protein